jgi:hypothetical protein
MRAVYLACGEGSKPGSLIASVTGLPSDFGKSRERYPERNALMGNECINIKLFPNAGRGGGM